MKWKKTLNLLYSFALNFYRLRHAFKNIWKEFWFFEMIKLLFLNLIWKRDKIVYLKNLKLYTKPNFFIITTLIEIFNIELYKKLDWLNCVLDLWAYIWESSVYLSRHNKKVVCFEPSKSKFELLEKNISKYSNIEWYNYAVVWDKDIKELTFFQRTDFDFCSSNVNEKKLPNKTIVQCKDIFSILDKYEFDWIKMDIEWWEYPIIKVLMNLEKFTFKKGIIEFHFVWDDKNEKINLYKKFYKFLLDKKFTIRVFDNFDIDILENEFSEIWTCDRLNYLNLEFYKK